MVRAGQLLLSCVSNRRREGQLTKYAFLNELGYRKLITSFHTESPSSQAQQTFQIHYHDVCERKPGDQTETEFELISCMQLWCHSFGPARSLCCLPS